MKRYQTILIGLLMCGSMLSSCTKWLDVDSDTNIVQELLFDKHEGFYTAVNGVYVMLGEPELYARDLNWGVASVIGNNYDISTSGKLPKRFLNLATQDYATSDNAALIDPIWQKSYNVIANCNNIIEQVQQKDSSFFPYGGLEKDMILGEMLGLRAMLHLDMVRLFAPSSKADDGRPYIPYMTVYPQQHTEHLSVQAVMANIIRDLEQAKSLLAVNDTLDPNETFVMQSARYRFMFLPYEDMPGGIFFGFRGFRMNYFAATALLARAYLWRDSPGDKEKALTSAMDMYRFSTQRTWFSFTAASNLQTTDPNLIYRKMFDDIIMAAYNPHMYDIYTTSKVLNEYYYLSNVSPLFGTDLDDFRLQYLMEGTTNKISRRWEPPTATTSSQEVNAQATLAPIIRMSEVVYAICECMADTDLGGAVNLLSKVRLARGAKAPLTVNNREEFLEILYNDMTREFQTEGQTFFLYKRLNRPIYNGAVPRDMTNRYVLPIPHSESAYINL